MKDGRRGLTLVEMMLAVGILIVIASLAIPAMTRARESAKKDQAMLELQMLFTAVHELAWDTGKWPGGIARQVQSSAETWDLSTSNAGLVAAGANFPNWKGPYVSEIRRDPWGSRYFFDPDYYINGQPKVVVGSFGPNRVGPNVYDADDIYIVLE